MNEREIFAAAVEKTDPRERAAFLDEACGPDAELRQRIEELLEEDENLGSFLETPAVARSGSATVDHVAALQPGDRIGPYKLLQKLGEGGMGVVFMGEQHEPVKRRVALKIVKPGMDSRQVVARFEAERQAIAMMDHPNIARAIDVGTTSHGHPYFVMELVKGIPITKYCDEHRLTPRQRMELFIPICQAVQHAHQKGIIHRDIKPSNILVAEYDHQAVPKIIDFGVAKALNQQLTDKTMFTQLGQVIGTLEYMSPEQAKVNQLDIDTRSDIYSLGVLLYELLTGSTPFDKERLRSAAWDELVRIIREEEPPRPSMKLSTSETLPSVAACRTIEPAKLSTLVRGELDWIVMKALDKDRNRRYETANGFGMDIKRYLDDEPVLACPPSAVYRFQKFARRNRGAFITTSLIAAALLIGVFGTAWQAVRATQQRDHARQQTERALEAEELAQQRLEQTETARQRESDQRQRAQTAEVAAKEQRDEALAEKSRADEQAAIAKAVNRFMLRDLFDMADAAMQLTGRIEPDPNVKLTTLLDRARKTVDQRFDDQPQIRAEIQATLANAFRAIGRYDEAVALQEEATRYNRNVLGEEHPDTLDWMNSLACLYAFNGRYDEAIQLHERTLELMKNILGEKHPDTLISMNNLAATYRLSGRYDEAIQLHERALALQIEVSGEENPDTLISMNNLAQAYSSAGRYDEAFQLHERTLELFKKTRGEDHPDTLSSTSNLANAYKRAGRYDEAVQLHERTLELRIEILGEEHPDTLSSMGSLASVYMSAGRYDEAIQLHDRTLELRIKILGEKHPQTLWSMVNLANAYYLAGRYDEAIQLHERALALQIEVSGEENPVTLVSMGSLATVFRSAGRYDEASQLQEQTLELGIKILGEEHPKTLTLMNNLAMAYHSAGRYDEALQLHEQTLALRMKVLGEEHPDTLLSMGNLAAAYHAAGRYEEAIELQEQTLEHRKKILGPEHPHTLMSMGNVAEAYRAVGRYDEAIELQEQTLEHRKKILGPEHPHTLKSMSNLAFTLATNGKHAEAAKVYGDLLEVQQRVLGPEHQATQTTWHRLIIARDCEVGQWQTAAEAFAKLDSSNPLFGYQQALAWLGTGDIENYHRVVGEMRTRFADSDNPQLRYWLAWTTLLRPIPEDKREAALELAQSLVQTDAPNHFRLTLAATLLRCGSVPESIEQLEQLNTEYESADEQPSASSPAYLWYFLAMAYQQQGQDDDAKAWFDRANEWVARDTADDQPPVSWNRRLTYQLLHAEIEQLMSSTNRP